MAHTARHPTAWPDDRTFLNQPADPTTGLIDDGARQYDPLTGRFLSTDPILNPTDPQSMTGYQYANNNPVTHSDPTGLRVDDSAPGINTLVGAPANSPGLQQIQHYALRSTRRTWGMDPL